MTTKNTFHKQQPLTFRIIDSPMGIGKSASLMDLIRFHNKGFDPEPRRFIVFVPTIRERDERYGAKLDLKSPATRYVQFFPDRQNHYVFYCDCAVQENVQ